MKYTRHTPRCNYRFKIKKRRGRFLLLIGRAEDKGAWYEDIRRSAFVQLVPECGTDFATGAAAEEILQKVKKVLANHPLYGRVDA